jgi:hypothetical protein
VEKGRSVLGLSRTAHILNLGIDGSDRRSATPAQIVDSAAGRGDLSRGGTVSIFLHILAFGATDRDKANES